MEWWNDGMMDGIVDGDPKWDYGWRSQMGLWDYGG